MAKVFISHSSKDKPTATTLAEDLKRLGHTVWFDAWEIRVGDCIVTKVEHGIAECDAVILLLSTHAVASHWVEREWKAKYWDEVEANQVKVLPVLLEDCERPTLLKTKRYADVRGNAYATGLVELVRALPEVLVQVSADGANLPKEDARVSELLSKIHSRKAPLAECVADALALAISLGDADLRQFCEQELKGLPTDGMKRVPLKGGDFRDGAYRAIDTYASASAEINPMYFGWGGDLNNAFNEMASDPHFGRVKLIMTQPLAELERDAQGDRRGLVHVTMPIRNFLPNAKNPDAIAHCYARGDALVGVIDRIRAELTTRVMMHLPTVVK